ncbi:Fic family protein [Streptomyces sp. NPDC092903]|uniref:Fic family protein n=1 Tax=Streptomyces sp. NPDC092903 TaxID=3366017 RepID=UPI003801B5DC
MRRYEETHPWITFKVQLRELDPESWLLLGEAISKFDHMAGVPLQPAVADELGRIFLSKGAHATTQIEGNTLSEEQVRKRVDHELELPPSQQYLGQEIDNVVTGYNRIVDDVVEGHSLKLTVDRITEFNKIVLTDLTAPGDAPPGRIRTTSVVVGNHYRGAPAEDCEFLLDHLCHWLDQLRSETVGTPYERPVAVLSAILAHLYIAWIHPFEDGNGRTARLVEYQLLLQAGAPTVAAHVLADHYNKTRSAYYKELRITSQGDGPFLVTGLIKYALQGLVDGLRQQIEEIQAQQLGVTWVNYVHEAFHEKTTPACARQRLLVLELPTNKWTTKAAIRELTPGLALAYAGKGDKAVTRDVNALVAMDLVAKTKRGVVTLVRPRVNALRAFMPLVADPS